MRNDTIIQAAGLSIKLTGETRTSATVIIGGSEYSGEIGNPVGRHAPDQWIEGALLQGLYTLTDGEFIEVCRAISAEME